MICRMPYCNRAVRRRVERYMKSHPKLTFTQAYNEIYGKDYPEPGYGTGTSISDIYGNSRP